MWTFRNCFQRSVDLEAKLSCCNFSKKWVNKFVFLSWWHRNTWNLNFNFKLQVFPSRQDRKTNSSICFWGEVTTRQFCFEIYWPLVEMASSSVVQKFKFWSIENPKSSYCKVVNVFYVWIPSPCYWSHPIPASLQRVSNEIFIRILSRINISLKNWKLC